MRCSRRPRSDNLVETTEYPQLYVYDVCLERFGGRHEWMGFIDADEFLVLTGGALSLPELLRGRAPGRERHLVAGIL